MGLETVKCLFHLFFLLLPAYAKTASAPPSPSCRAVPGSHGWPQPEEWRSLNKSLDGRLLAPLPPAIVCDASRPSTFDSHACKAMGKKFFSGYFVENDPVSTYWPNFQGDACLPQAVYNESTSCNVDAFPHYVVNATSAKHVAAAVRFAKETGVRLSVKGTGHDYAGRGAAPGLLVWTHSIRGIEVHSSFTPKMCKTDGKGTTAVTISAGHTFGDVYAECGKQHVIPVVGADMTVGLGGYLLGGGHSPIGPKFGLAVDNVLEMTVVTPDGEIETINECQGSDLFWAFRGGAGSTYGVLISATLKTFPSFPATPFALEFSSTREEASKNDNSNFYTAIATMYSHIPRLSDNNVSSVFVFGPSTLISGISFSGSRKVKRQEALQQSSSTVRHSLKMAGQALDQDAEVLKRLLKPLSAQLNSMSGIKFKMSVGSRADILDIVQQGNNEKPRAGDNTLVGSRLLDKESLLRKDKLTNAFRALQQPPTIISGVIISGPGVRNASNPERTSVTPAWRRTYLHMTTGVNWAYSNKTASSEARELLNKKVAILRQEAPDMGSYNNEGDAEEPNFEQAFWGSNYERLLRIKDRYDPDGVFFCRGCVGSERWTVEKSGRICRI